MTTEKDETNITWLTRRSTTELELETDIENPFRLRPALFFGAVFAVVLLVSESANTWFGTSGLYARAFLSGLADVDAIMLTLSALAADGTISPAVATTGIVIGAIANTLPRPDSRGFWGHDNSVD